MELLNLGCGASYHPSWVNVDFVSTGPGVVAHNLLSGIPFPDQTFDAVYHSHVLEHFSQKDAPGFISECRRVLKPGGILRVAVPDLEGIARCYLKKLEACNAGDAGAADDYDWILLELFDQMARRESGGEMKRYLLSGKNKEFVSARIGGEATALWRPKDDAVVAHGRPKNMTLSRIAYKLRIELAKGAVSLFGGKAFRKFFEDGMFRNGGEPHLWMYDKYSLKKMLKESGLTDIQVCAADESRITDFGSFGLDVVEGVVRKPDSLYIEAARP